MKHLRVAVALLAVGLCVVGWCQQAGGTAQAALAPRPPLSVWQASSIYSTLQRLLDAGVTPDDLKPAVGALQAYIQADNAYYQRLHNPALVQAWQQIIDRLINGQPAAEEDFDKANPGEELDKLYRAQRDARKQAAAELAKCLKDFQLAELGASEKRRAAKDTVRQLADRRGAPPDRWKQWMDERIRSLVKRFGGNGADQMAQALTAFFQEVRNMPTDDFYAKTAQLVDRLTIILNGGQPEPREEQLKRVESWFSNVIGDWAMAATLLKWIQNGVVPGATGAGGG